MLLILLFYLLISFSCLWAGYVVYHSYVFRYAIDVEEKKSWIIYMFWGLVSFALTGQIVELILPLNRLTWAAVSLILLLVSVSYKNIFSGFLRYLGSLLTKDRLLIPQALLLICLVAILNAGPTMMDDTESYHIQMIKWIQEYGTVPGIANLHERFGFNSSWFAFISYFIPEHTALNYFTVVNGAISTWIAVYLLGNINGKETQKYPWLRLSCLFLFFAMMLSWPMIRGNASTANYDFITTCMIVVLFIESLKTGFGAHISKYVLPELLTWPVFLFTIRIINFPLLVLALFSLIWLFKKKETGMLTRCLILCVLLLIPFLIRNIILSGYPFYPSMALNFFGVDWKVNPQVAKDLLHYIKYFNRVNAGFLPIEETAKYKTPEWIPVWFHYLFNFDKPLLVAGLSGYVLTLMKLRSFYRYRPLFQLFFWVMILQLLSWFVIAPDPRFVYGPLLLGLVFFVLLFVKNPTGFTAVRSGIFASAIIVSAFFLLTMVKVFRNENYRNFFKPFALPKPGLRSLIIDNIEMKIPEKIPGNWNSRCYATDLPCIYEAVPGLHARGNSIEDGFYLKK